MCYWFLMGGIGREKGFSEEKKVIQTIHYNITKQRYNKQHDDGKR